MWAARRQAAVLPRSLGGVLLPSLLCQVLPVLQPLAAAALRPAAAAFSVTAASSSRGGDGPAPRSERGRGNSGTRSSTSSRVEVDGSRDARPAGSARSGRAASAAPARGGAAKRTLGGSSAPARHPDTHVPAPDAEPDWVTSLRQAFAPKIAQQQQAAGGGGGAAHAVRGGAPAAATTTEAAGSGAKAPKKPRVPKSVLRKIAARGVSYKEPPAAVLTRVWTPPPEPAALPQRSLAVAIVGAPNAGKSTLLNKMLGTKVSAVSKKYNTTRDRVLGIWTDAPSATQVVMFDTPGFVPDGGDPVLSGGHRYVSSLVTAAKDTIPQVDVVLYVVDAAKRVDAGARASLARVVQLAAAAGAHVFVVANKVDLLKGHNVTKALKLLSSKGKEGAAASTASAVELDDDEGGEEGDRTAPSKALSSRQRRAEAGEVMRAKLDMVMDAMEEACFSAGVIGAGGFDEPSAGAGAGSPGLGAVYKFFPPVIPISAANDEADLGALEGKKGGGVTARAGDWSRAGTGLGVAQLKALLLRLAVPRPWEYGAGQTTDLSPAERVTEAVREQLFRHLHREVPYKVELVLRSWEERTPLASRTPTGDVIIHMDVAVPSSTVARMLKARGGAPMRVITESSIKELEPVLGKIVRLYLHITVKEKLKKFGGTGAPLAAEGAVFA